MWRRGSGGPDGGVPAGPPHQAGRVPRVRQQGGHVPSPGRQQLHGDPPCPPPRSGPVGSDGPPGLFQQGCALQRAGPDRSSHPDPGGSGRAGGGVLLRGGPVRPCPPACRGTRAGGAGVRGDRGGGAGGEASGDPAGTGPCLCGGSIPGQGGLDLPGQRGSPAQGIRPGSPGGGRTGRFHLSPSGCRAGGAASPERQRRGFPGSPGGGVRLRHRLPHVSGHGGAAVHGPERRRVRRGGGAGGG